MKALFAALMMLVASNTYAAQDTGGDFYVIPVVKEVIKKVEVCRGEPLGKRSFSLEEGGFYLGVDDVYVTSTGYLVQITGINNGNNGTGNRPYIFTKTYYLDGGSFRVSPSSLPTPDYGVKGPYFYIEGGALAYAKYL